MISSEGDLVIFTEDGLVIFSEDDLVIFTEDDLACMGAEMENNHRWRPHQHF